jgi:hypothetical protein
MCEVSIIIPNWNGGGEVSTCLDSILQHTQGVEFELIVIDNGSSDESRAAIKNVAAGDHRVKPIFNDRNHFFARACNQGYEISRGKYLLIANNDILLSDDAVTTLVRYAEKHPDVGVVTPLFTNLEGQPQEFVRRLPSALHILAHYHRLARAVDRFVLRRSFQDSYFYRDRSFHTVEEIEQAGASFSLFRRDVIRRSGGLFDEQFPLLFNDVDLYRRIKDHGFSSCVVPSIRVVHLEGVSSRKLDAARYQRLQDRGMFGYFKKHHPIQYGLLALAWPMRWSRTLGRNKAVATW